MKISARLLLALAVIAGHSLASTGIGGAKKPLLTEVTVFDAKGKPAGNRQIILEFDDPKGPVFTAPASTSAKGIAKVKHAAEGKVKVWVDRDHSTHLTTGPAPGKITVRLGRASPYPAIDSHALKAPREAEQSLDALAKYLAQPAKNDLDKARALFRWIIDRVAYDVEGQLAGRPIDNTPEGVLKNRTCNCQGYSQLFDALATKMGLEEAFITGHLRTYDPNRRQSGTVTHGWNAVKIDGAWQLFDTTNGAGTSDGKKFIKETREFYFQAAPELLLFTQFPDDARWQLRDPPLTKDEFDAFPYVSDEMIRKMGLPAARIRKMVKDENIKEFCTFFTTPGREAVFRDAPVAGTLKAGTKYHFLLESADCVDVAFDNDGRPVNLQKRGPLFEGYILPRKGILKLVGFQQPNWGHADTIVRYEVK